jgi:hypothetical protein
VAPNPLLTLIKYFPDEVEACLGRLGPDAARELSIFETMV